MNKKDIDPANVQIRHMEDEDGHAVAVIDSVYFGAPQPEYYRKKLGSATKGSGINTSLIAEARMSISQGACKG